MITSKMDKKPSSFFVTEREGATVSLFHPSCPIMGPNIMSNNEKAFYSHFTKREANNNNS